MRIYYGNDCFSVFSAGILLTSLGLVLSTDCPSYWTVFDGSCYLFGTHTPLNFSDAEDYCRQHGGHLAHIDSDVESTFIRNYLRDNKHSTSWIGLTDQATEGTWLWYDTQTAPDFTDWQPGEPNDQRHHEDCVYTDARFDFKWNDAPCGNKYEYICEIRGIGTEIIG